MEDREPLAPGTELQLWGQKYTIVRCIAWGGQSLLYVATTEGGTVSMILKEFYPRDAAMRDGKLGVRPRPLFELGYQASYQKFLQEGKIGGEIAEKCFQIIPFLQQHDRYAVMQKESADMISLQQLVQSWEMTPPLPASGRTEDVDPVFPDMVRVQYALHVISSLLTPVKVLHEMGYLHMDLTDQNVLWAGKERESGQNCNAFLSDFGCVLRLEQGVCTDWNSQTCSGPYIAPEFNHPGRDMPLTPATDLFSVGMLLFYLCVGEKAKKQTCRLTRKVRVDLQRLQLPEKLREALSDLIQKAIAPNPEHRFPSAEEMKRAVWALYQQVPSCPINRDNTRSFTLNSLRTLLEGGSYTWAEELCARRGVGACALSDEQLERVRAGVCSTSFAGDRAFLQAVLPDAIYEDLLRKAAGSSAPDQTLAAVLCGRIEESWKEDFCHQLVSGQGRALLGKSRAVLQYGSAQIWIHNKNLLLSLLGEEADRLKRCIQNCSSFGPAGQLALITVFALLGPEGFQMFAPSPRMMYRVFK